MRAAWNMTHGKGGRLRRAGLSVLLAPAVMALAVLGGMTALPKSALAQSCCVCGCECEDAPDNGPKTRFTVVDEHRKTRMHFGTAASFGADVPSPRGEPHTGEMDPPNPEFPVDLDLNHGGVGGGRQIPHFKWDNPWPDHPTYGPGETLTLPNAVPAPPNME